MNANKKVTIGYVVLSSLLLVGIGPAIVAGQHQIGTLSLMSPRDSAILTNDREVFHTYQTATTELQTLASSYPSITRLYSLGTSVQGRTIWGMKISNNPAVEENEPEFRIIGLHHGNEYMGMEIALTMCSYLTSNYGTLPLVTDLVNQREIWIIPMMNPDGLELHQRTNANGVDLNRDYGYIWGGQGSSPRPYSQVETQTIRNHAFANTFGLSLSFHTAALYVNYLWNYKPQRTPDDTLIVQLSNAYASHTGYTVIEGYDWYQTLGDCNDFSYGCRGDIDWTIETPGSNIASVCSANRDAILEMMDSQDIGLQGVVTDAVTGLPLKATVWVDQVYWPCYTDPAVGDYHKLLLPGDYTVHFRANGYQEQSSNVHIADSTPVVMNVALTPGGNRYAYQVFWARIIDSGGNGYLNNPTDVISALGPSDTRFASLGKGGSVCLDMAENGEIINGPGNDFTVYEGETPEGYSVSVSSTGEYSGAWVSLGTATGTASFDLSTGGVQRARYVRIVDDNVGSGTEQNPGFDLNAIQTLHAVQETQLVLSGDSFYQNLTPASPITVDVVNLNTKHRWQATTNNNHYSCNLSIGVDINVSETLRIVTRDTTEYVNVTDHLVTSADALSGSIIVDPLLSIHYLDLRSFPYYTAATDRGAATAQMMLNYLFWNRSVNPTGPPLYFADQNALFTAFNTQGGLYLNADELCTGLNLYRPSPVDLYGYFFAVSSDLDASIVLQDICVWLDYNMSFYNAYHSNPWPKPGFSSHVPIAMPAYGTYNDWMVIRGIHTDRDAWQNYPMFPNVTVFGLWLNDPNINGIGANTYVTAEQFLSTYFQPIGIVGDAYNDKYVVITDPPETIPVSFPHGKVTIADSQAGFTCAETQLLHVAAEKTGLHDIAEKIIIQTAYQAAEKVLRLDERYATTFSTAHVLSAPIREKNVYKTMFRGGTILFTVLIQSDDGSLLEIRIDDASSDSLS